MASEEPHIVAALIDLCRELGVKTLVQVGAEDGFEAAAIQDAIGCRAVAIEADYKCDPCNDRIEYHRNLIGGSDSTVDFYVNTVSGLSSKIRRGTGHEERHSRRQHRLDTFCLYHGIEPDALIIDTEGTTLDVLNGAGMLLDFVKLVYAEVQGDNLAVIDAHLEDFDLVRRPGLPSYNAGEQNNLTWVAR